MSRFIENLSLGFQTRSNTNQPAQPQKMARGLKFQIWEVEGLHYLCRENKGVINCRLTVNLICTFFYAYSKSRFSHDAPEIVCILEKQESSPLNVLECRQCLNYSLNMLSQRICRPSLVLYMYTIYKKNKKHFNIHFKCLNGEMFENKWA